MWLIVQIAVGVCVGMLLFKFLIQHPAPSLPRPSVKGALAFCVSAYMVLYVLHIILTTWR